MSLALPQRSWLVDCLAALGAKAGFDAPFELTPVRGGNNNQIYRMQTPQHVFAVKIYFSHRGDARERLQHEFEFLRYVWASGVRTVPEPYAADHENNLAVYEFIAGHTVNTKGVTLDDVDAAMAFYRAINASHASAVAQRLAPASEAAFSISEHLSKVDTRIKRLQHIDGTSDADAEAKQFVSAEVVPLWSDVRRTVHETAQRHGVLSERLKPGLRRVSPSDFGFHNAIAQQSGVIKFIDFEYAGWDDPAKLVCDFANQPDNLLPADFSDAFRQAVVKQSPDDARLADRVLWLTPVYQIKWTCIVLNIFSTLGKDRHGFVTGEQDPVRRKTEQLKKARVMLERARTSYSELRHS